MRAIVATCVLFVAAPVAAQLNQGDEPPGRGCRDDLLFVDVPVATRLPPRFHRIVAAAAGHLQDAAALAADDAARLGVPGWFEPGVKPEVRRERLLPRRRAGDGYRVPGYGAAHQRFWRLSFHDDGERKRMARDAQCDVVATTRAAVRQALADDGQDPKIADSLHIGRACDLSGQIEGAPSDEMLEWHLDRLGVAPQHPDAPGGSARDVHVALLDTSVEQVVVDLLGGTCSDDGDPESFAGVCAVDPGDANWHAGAMGLLVRQVAPNARLHFYPAIGPDSNAPVGELARALDRALHEADVQGDALVLNISAGWAPELGSPSLLVGDTLLGPHGDILENTCRTREDPVGESVRWMLDAARRRDAREAPTAVHAAAGNRSSSPYEDVVGWGLAHGVATDPCGFNPALGQSLDAFYPAEWHRRLTCRTRADGSTTAGRSLAVAIAASDHHEQPSVHNVPFTDVAIHGPGQHVYVDAQGWVGDIPPTEVAPACGTGGLDARAPFLTLPKAISGTSASTALASGIAARALEVHAEESEARVAAGRRTLQDLNRRRLARMLWFTGERMCGSTPTGLLQRRVSMERFEQALQHRRARRLLRCAGQPEPFGLLLPGLLEDCAGQLASVGLPEDPASCLFSEPDLPWPAEPVAPCDTYDAPCDPALGCPRPDAGDCGFPLCAYELESPDRYSIGSLGPQPGDPWCPDCLFSVLAPGNLVRLTADLAMSIPASAVVTKTYLRIKKPDGRSAYASVSAYVPDSAWFAGNYFKATITLPASVHGFSSTDWKNSSATLVVNSSTGGLYARNESTLRIVP